MKKKTLTICILFALVTKGFSQDCDNLITTSMDHITGKIDAAAASAISLTDSAGDQVTLAPALRNNQLTISLTITGSSSWCFDRTCMAYFIFKDKSQFSYSCINDFNCDGVFILKIMANTNLPNQGDPNLRILTGKVIQTIRLKTMHSYVHFSMDKEDSDLLDKQLTCLRELQTTSN